MTNITKSHAKDYLLEYKARNETPFWLSLLIQKVVDTDGKISDEDRENIFANLLSKNGIGIEKENPAQRSNKTTDYEEVIKNIQKKGDKLTLKKITHIRGVNALIPDESITFSPSCTVVYGLNGTGKSGYFRIIHELAGGIKQKNILDNIHKPGSGLKVSVDFLLDGDIQDSYEWEDKYKRGVTPFNHIKVFDSGYLPIFLDERENSINVEPLGLNLFQVITTTIDEIKEKLNQLKQQEANQQPDLQSLVNIIYSDDLIRILQGSFLSKEGGQQLNANLTFLSEESARLVQLKKDKSLIEKNNTEDSQKVLSQEKKEADELRSHLITIKETLETLTRSTSTLIKDYLAKKKTRDERVKQFEVLKDIPSQNTEEWHAFIESAESYGVNIKQDVFNKKNKCIYCHQSLNKEALELVTAYSKYLGDQSQQNFKNTIDEVDELKIALDAITVDFPFSENLKKVLIKTKNKQGQNYKTLVEQVLKEAREQKTKLKKATKDKRTVAVEYSLDLKTIDNKLNEISNKKQGVIYDLQQSELQRQQKIKDLDTEIEALEDKQNISKWKSKINKYFLCCHNIQRYSGINQGVSTRGITELGSKAHDELLTESIRKSFETELEDLGKNIEVNLEKTGADKGMVRTRLKILGNNVRDILSDGEQKAVGLALFLAEIASQDNNYPIVFDDPVTSIDHEVADSLAKKLLQISSSRQIIIFTHNKLFYNSLVYWGNNLKDANSNRTHHVCKNYTEKGCNGKGCHTYTYRVDREAKDKTGRILEAQNESCLYFIEKAENEMKGDYSVVGVSSYLKSAIEHYIDERILLNTSLMKDRLRGVGVPWENLKKMDSKIEVVKKLEGYWGDLSNRGSHATQNSEENQLKAEDFNNIITFLKS